MIQWRNDWSVFSDLLDDFTMREIKHLCLQGRFVTKRTFAGIIGFIDDDIHVAIEITTQSTIDVNKYQLHETWIELETKLNFYFQHQNVTDRSTEPTILLVDNDVETVNLNPDRVVFPSD